MKKVLKVILKTIFKNIQKIFDFANYLGELKFGQWKAKTLKLRKIGEFKT